MRKRAQVTIFIILAVILTTGIIAVFYLSAPQTDINGNNKIFCSSESRNAEACIKVYRPVCGFVKAECITTPCPLVPETFSNSCFACMNERVEYYMGGKCS